MPGAGTDKTKNWIEGPAPVVILVSPQLAENIGAAARAMANFGLGRLRLVTPLQPWPNEKARVMAAGADRVLDNTVVFDSLKAAIADCTLVMATTARAHDQAKPVIGPDEAARILAAHVGAGEKVAILFGRERAGLENHEVALADYIVTLPVNPAFASLNLAQAVLVVAYEWFKHASGGQLPFDTPERSVLASKDQLGAFFANLERELERVEFFRPAEKRDTMAINLRNIFNRIRLTQQDIRTLHGVVLALAEGRKGPAKGGVLDGEAANMLRALIAEHGEAHAPLQTSPVRRLARLLRRNPTEAERTLWIALVNDRRFSGRGFKRQVPVGRHMTDFVSFSLRTVIDVLPEGESEAAARGRAERAAWLTARNYRVIAVRAGEIEKDVGKVLQDLDAAIRPGG